MVILNYCTGIHISHATLFRFLELLNFTHTEALITNDPQNGPWYKYEFEESEILLRIEERHHSVSGTLYLRMSILAPLLLRNMEQGYEHYIRMVQILALVTGESFVNPNESI